ncbi:hypothetical protein ASC77_10815 [Nocardioides sp. Root1257]|uniref:hypothetical protein n=1 Tax=unclassified Nocardioides TaxID=2615069 RepID=UPI0006FB67A7|nr:MULTISPECIES: hypothetical protein [unclassified Nocardioides]KQW49176.1 hypothetical protein ASC77_10815 [Nocardioides sp. Root1257]KRC48350.1 hypothetical protein ASE24_10820 [Nocardioides sp. Root224]
MNTLHDLRSTLDRHADDLDDSERYVRPVAVRARIRAVRRRRAGAVAAVAAVAVVAVVAAAGTLRSPQSVEPAGPTVIGIDVPEDLAILGFPYTLSRTVELSAADPALVMEQDDDRAVSLVGRDLGSGSVTLLADGEPIARARGDEAVEAPVPTAATRLRIRLDGASSDARAAVAIYHSTPGLAPGTTDGDRAVFRDEVAGQRLLTAAFSGTRPEVTVTHAGDLADVRISDYCRADEKGLWMQITLDGSLWQSGECHTVADVDAAASSSASDEHTTGDHVVRAYVTRGMDGPVVTDTRTVVGLAVYERLRSVRTALGTPVDPVVEEAGRTWTLARVTDSDHATVDTSDGDRLLVLVSRGDMVYASWRGALLRGRSAYMSSGPGTGPGTLSAGVLLAGDTYDVQVRSEGPGGEGALLVYRPE